MRWVVTIISTNVEQVPSSPPGDRVRYYSKKIFLSLPVKIGFIALLLASIIVGITITSVKAHSESDVKYRQQSLFADVEYSATARYGEVEVNNSVGTDVILQNKVDMTFEVDEITPTPTPIVDPTSDDIWMKLADCESHKNWKAETGNGYYGGLQFSLGAWASVGGSGKPSEASAEEQISKGKLLQSRRGWGPWGGCSKKLGLN